MCYRLLHIHSKLCISNAKDRDTLMPYLSHNDCPVVEINLRIVHNYIHGEK